MTRPYLYPHHETNPTHARWNHAHGFSGGTDYLIRCSTCDELVCVVCDPDRVTDRPGLEPLAECAACEVRLRA